MERVTLGSIPRSFGAAALVAVLALTGCSASTARTTGTSDGAGVVGVTLPSADDLAWVRAGDALSAELRERGYRVDLQFAAADTRTQVSQAQNMITKGEDAVVLVPVSLDALAAAREAAAAEDVPVVAVARDLDGAGAFVAVDPAEVGRAQAEALLDDLGTAPATVAVLAGATEDPDAAARHAAAIEALAPAVAAGTVTLLTGADFADAAVADEAAGVESAAEDRAREMVGEEERPTAMLALGDAVTRGVVTALTTPDPDASPSPSPSPDADDAVPAPVVIGSGGDTATVRALRDGVVEATVFVDTRLVAPTVADAVAAALTGQASSAGPALEAAVVRWPEVQAVFLGSGWLDAGEL